MGTNDSNGGANDNEQQRETEKSNSVMASFLAYLPLLQAVEGGFQKIASDPGNYNSLGQLVGTNFGISARFYEDIIGYPPTEADMKAIGKPLAQNIFKQYFWDANLGNQIKNQSVANTVIDHQINSGRGIKLAQHVLKTNFNKNLAIDGAMGPNTLAAINSVDPQSFVKTYNQARANYYVSIGNDDWVNGWLNRLEKFAYKHSTLITVGAIFNLGLIAGISYYLINHAKSI